MYDCKVKNKAMFFVKYTQIQTDFLTSLFVTHIVKQANQMWISFTSSIEMFQCEFGLNRNPNLQETTSEEFPSVISSRKRETGVSTVRTTSEDYDMS